MVELSTKQGVVLAVTEPGRAHGSALEGLIRSPDLDVHCVRDSQAAEVWLSQQDTGHVDAIVLGPEVTQPLAAARRLRRTHRGAQIIFVLAGSRLERFRSMLPFVPEVGDAWTADAGVSAESLRRILGSAVRTARTRRDAATLTQRINRLLGHQAMGDEEHRRQRRQALSQAYLASLLSQAPDPIFATDIDGTVIAWNDAATALFGRSPESGPAGSILSLVPQADREELRLRMRRASGGERAAPYETRITGADGHAREVELNLAAIHEPLQPTAMLSFVAHDITERKRAEERIKASLAEKQVLLKEVHHRVKNNLQVINSLLFLKARTLPDALRHPFEESGRRISAMARVHDRLSASQDVATISLEGFVGDLCQEAALFYGVAERVEIRIAVDEAIALDLETATPLALLLNELVSNALKHAFPDDRHGTVTVTAETTNDAIELTVRDDGIGLPKDYATQGRLGLGIVNALASQIGAQLSGGGDGGTAFTLRMPRRA